MAELLRTRPITRAATGRVTPMAWHSEPTRGKKRKSVFPIATAAAMEIGIRRIQPEGAARRLCWPHMAREGFTALPRIEGLYGFLCNLKSRRIKYLSFDLPPSCRRVAADQGVKIRRGE